MHLHRRDPEARLEMHLLESAMSGVVESADCPFRPAAAFRKEGFCQEHRHGSGSEPDAGCEVTIGAKAPFQRGSNVIDVNQWDRSLLPLVFDPFEQLPIILSMSLSELL